MWFWSSVAWTTNRIAHRYVCWLSCVLNCKRVFTCDRVTCVFCPNMTLRCWLCIRHQDWRVSQPQLWWAKSLVNSSVHWLLLTTALQCPVVAPARPVSLPNGRLHFDAYVLTCWERRMLFPRDRFVCCCCKLHATIPVSHYLLCFVRLEPNEFLNGLSYYFSAGTWAGKTMWCITVISHMTSMLSQPFTNEGLWGWGLFFVYQISVGGGHSSFSFERHTVSSNLR